MDPDEARRRQLRAEYTARINRVIDHIEVNLDQRLTLERLARVASFSPYHFHRIFGAMQGETLSHFIQRIRVERTAMQLISNPKKSITAIALDCGFSGSASFARAFKDHFGMTASDWRGGGHLRHRKICKQDSKDGQPIGKERKAYDISICHFDPVTNNPNWRIAMKNESKLDATVEVKEMPELDVAYVRHVGPYAGQVEVFERIFGTLMGWAGPRGLCSPDAKVLSVYHDDPEVTAEDKLRVSACLTVPHGTEVEGEIGKMKVPGGKFAVARFELASDQYADAWNAVMGGWMPESGFQPDDRLCYELCHNNPQDHPEGKQIIDICVPVRPL